MKTTAQRLIPRAAALLLLSCFFYADAGEPPDGLREGIATFRRGLQTWDYAAFTNAATRFEQLADREPKKHAAHYWQGAALFHAVLHRQGHADGGATDKAASRHMRDAVEALERAVALQPNDSESHALLSTLIGMRIGASPLSAIWRGRAVLRHRDRALENNPENPRTYYLIATSQYHAPKRTESQDKGLAMFLKAADLFAKELAADRDDLAPRWGYDHCLAFLGKVHQEKGDIDTAKRYYGEALAINPLNRRAKEGLQQCQTMQTQNPSS